ncbi:PadR family transcriptional regulator [Glaciibacter flavus]|uniref:PadR family transcriptional regulator n=1 Tax=Orlajensenia flava TaxID=2565934 RepID=UPI003AFF82F6
MSVRMGLLAILDEGACYGHQLRSEFDRRTAATTPLNVGQVYSTLDRLERDGLVARGETDADGLQLWRITPLGSAAVSDWLGSPVARVATGRDELVVKVALAVTLPGVDALALLETELAAAEDRVSVVGVSEAGQPAPESLPGDVIAAAGREAAAADIRWLTVIRNRVLASPELAAGLPNSAVRPRRGRPARSDESESQALSG